MKKINLLIIIIIAIFALSSCGGSSNDNATNNENSEITMSEMNLFEKGIPVTFLAPEEVEISDGLLNGEFDGIVLHNYEVKKGSFIMDVLMDDADVVDDIATYLEYAKEEDNEDFVEFVKEEENGYIAKLKSEDGDNYAFYYVLIKDNRAIEFSEGLNFSDYTLEQIETLYNTAKAAK